MKKFWKWITPVIIAFGVCIASNITTQIQARAETIYSKSATLQANNNIVTIYNEKLRQKVFELLDKKSGSDLYVDDFLNHNKYKATTTQDPNTGLDVTTAQTYQLDLSNSGITDIRELCQFQFPSTLQGINLAGNGITKEHLENISALVNAKQFVYSDTEKKDVQNTFSFQDRTYNINTDFYTLIKKVNLNDNNIDLSKPVNIDSKFLIGFQQIGNIHETGLVREGEINPQYYINELDYNYLSYIVIDDDSPNEEGKLNLNRNQKSYLLPENNYGKYTIKVSKPLNSATSYFNEYEFYKEFTLFSVEMKDGFWVERGNILNLKLQNNTVTADSNIVVEGLGISTNGDFSITNPSSPNTEQITDTKSENGHKNYVSFTLKKGNKSRTVKVEFLVKDTIAPLIKLSGGNYVYSSQNKEFREPGYITYDPISKNTTTLDITESDDGKGIHSHTEDRSNLNILKLGEYEIKYIATDFAGNTTTVIRTVNIIEKALDRLTVTISKDNFKEGEEITITVQPETGTPLDNFTSFQYTWYLNGVQFKTTAGNSRGKSIINYIATKSEKQEITVTLVATQKNNDIKVEVTSDPIQLNINPSFRNNDTLILALGIVVLGIILFIAILTFIKYKKSKGKTHGKHKNFIKSKSSKKSKQANTPQGPEIQVIKNYSGDPNKSALDGTGEQNGGNENVRPSETDNTNTPNQQ
ncbi:MAG: DUF5011 domain-containing protein [Clostridia bacterium]|nr:DUF5011 domain-containing protein [Clostridia bacterium]